eukprot:3467461-Rhodomonas_salina.4
MKADAARDADVLDVVDGVRRSFCLEVIPEQLRAVRLHDHQVQVVDKGAGCAWEGRGVGPDQRHPECATPGDRVLVILSLLNGLIVENLELERGVAEAENVREVHASKADSWC